MYVSFPNHHSTKQFFQSQLLHTSVDIKYYISDYMMSSVIIFDLAWHLLPLTPDDLSSTMPCSMTPDHEELVAIESVTLHEEAEKEDEKDPLADSGYIELHYYQFNQYQYLVLPGDTELDLETVEILQLDAEAQEAAGSLLDLAGGGHSG